MFAIISIGSSIICGTRICATKQMIPRIMEIIVGDVNTFFMDLISLFPDITITPCDQSRKFAIAT